MHWRVKNDAFKVLEKLPLCVGDALYHNCFQPYSGSLDPVRALKMFLYSFDMFSAMLSRTGRSFAGIDILELGSGWYPGIPYLLLYRAGASTVNTYDICEHFSFARIRRFNAAFEACLALRPKVNQQSPYALPREVRYFPNTSLVTSPLPDHSVDLAISSWVLEYIAPNDLLELHRVFRRSLRPGGALLHLVSPCDDRAYSDRTLSRYDFLKYSEPEWKAITTRFFYHNRLRLPQYLEVFKAAGFRVEYQMHKPLPPGSRELSKFSSLRLHPDFARFSFEELTANPLQFVLS